MPESLWAPACGGGLEPPAKGHFDFPIFADDVDILPLVSDSVCLCILKTLSYDAIPGAAQ
jgi:hypothetical protein